MELTGKIIVAYPKQSGVSAKTGNSWASQEFVLETEEQYPRKCLFRVFGEDRLQKFALSEGKRVRAFMDVDAHLYNNRYYNEIQCWRIDPC